MKIRNLQFCAVLLSVLALCFGCKKSSVNGASETLSEINPASQLPLADPYILLHDNVYYIYGTHSDDGIEAYSSTDLKNWHYEGIAAHKDNLWGDRWFWAPEVYFINNKFYMFLSIDEHICMATADSPTGPFLQTEQRPIWDEKSIDTSVFIDTDGTPYLYFVRFTDGNVIWVAQLTDDLTDIKTETLRQCIAVDEPWELAQDFPARVAEGPSVFKHGDTYYMMYSANHYKSKEYAVGYAISNSPMGPWTKAADSPVLHRADNLVGTGHGAPFTTEDGSMMYVFHAHWNQDTVAPRLTYIKPMQFAEHGKITIQGDLITPVRADNEDKVQ